MDFWKGVGPLHSGAHSKHFPGPTIFTYKATDFRAGIWLKKPFHFWRGTSLVALGSEFSRTQATVMEDGSKSRKICGEGCGLGWGFFIHDCLASLSSSGSKSTENLWWSLWITPRSKTDACLSWFSNIHRKFIHICIFMHVHAHPHVLVINAHTRDIELWNVHFCKL